MNKAVSDIIHIDPALATPVYKQIVQSIVRNIESGNLTRDDVLPSVNKIAEVFSLARGSVFTAYNDLRASGIIDSIPGKGYFIASTETKQNKRVFVLFNSLLYYNEPLYTSLVNSLPAAYTVDIHYYNNSIKTFETLIRQHAGYYNLFVVIPPVNEHIPTILSQLDPKSLLLLEFGYKEYRKEFAGVFQNFDKDIYSLLLSKQEAVANYKRLVLIAPNEPFTRDIISGFNKYSKKTNIATTVKTVLNTEDIKRGDAYIVVDDSDLVAIVQYAQSQKLKIGKDIGLLSYNESKLKSVIAEGITTITPAYEEMGKAIAEMILSRKREAIESKYVLIDRKSF